MSSNFYDVGEFHRRFGLPHAHLLKEGGVPDAHPTGAQNNKHIMEFRIKFMEEELQEFIEGYQDQDIAQMADALIDLAYVVFGAAHFLGLPWQELWDDVQRANMTKERAAADGSNSKRGSSFDVVKPPGWTGPNTGEILAKYGFEL